MSNRITSKFRQSECELKRELNGTKLRTMPLKLTSMSVDARAHTTWKDREKIYMKKGPFKIQENSCVVNITSFSVVFLAFSFLMSQMDRIW